MSKKWWSNAVAANRPTGISRLVVALAIAGVLPTLAHFAYSRFGFNPTDDGLVLAYSRRLLDGEVPGRDFVFIRPAGSPLLHAPLLLVAGDHLLWMSRWVVWFEFGAITWCWLVVAQRLVRPMWVTTQVALGIMAFALGVHNFPLINWYTIDGLFLCSVGIALATSTWTPVKLVGYAIVGAATLTKQNFGVVAPLAILVLGDARRPLTWVAAASAPLAYGLFLFFAGGLADSWQQLTALEGLPLVGWTNYLENESCRWGLGLGAASMALLAWRNLLARAAGAILVFYVLYLVGAAFAAADWASYGSGTPFLMFGAILGIAVVATLHREAGVARLGILATLAAWSVSISLGYNSPALASGALVIALVAPCLAYLDAASTNSRATLLVTAVLILFAAWTGTSGHRLRLTSIYREPPADKLDVRLDGVLPGGRGILTSASTYRYIVDLKAAVDKAAARGKPYAILPDFPGWWALASQRNVVLVDWAFPQEVPTPALVDRVDRAIDAQRGNLVVIVARVCAELLSLGIYPRHIESSPISHHVETTWKRTDRAEWFDLYE